MDRNERKKQITNINHGAYQKYIKLIQTLNDNTKTINRSIVENINTIFHIRFDPNSQDIQCVMNKLHDLKLYGQHEQEGKH